MKKADFERAYALCSKLERLSDAVQTAAVKEEAKKAEEELKVLEAKFEAWKTVTTAPLELVQILLYRYFWGLQWYQVSRAMGYKTPDTPRKRVQRYLKKLEQQ